MKFDIKDVKSWANRHDVKVGDEGYFCNHISDLYDMSNKEINVVKKQLDENVDSNSDSYIRYIFDLIRKCFKG